MMSEQEYTFRPPSRVIARYASVEEYYEQVANHQAALDRIAALEAEKATGWAVLRDATTEMGNRAAYWSQKATEEAAEHGNDFETARAVTKCVTYSSVEAFLKRAAEADHIARVTALLEPDSRVAKLVEALDYIGLYAGTSYLTANGAAQISRTALAAFREDQP